MAEFKWKAIDPRDITAFIAEGETDICPVEGDGIKGSDGAIYEVTKLSMGSGALEGLRILRVRRKDAIVY